MICFDLRRGHETGRIFAVARFVAVLGQGREERCGKREGAPRAPIEEVISPFVSAQIPDFWRLDFGGFRGGSAGTAQGTVESGVSSGYGSSF